MSEISHAESTGLGADSQSAAVSNLLTKAQTEFDQLHQLIGRVESVLGDATALRDKIGALHTEAEKQNTSLTSFATQVVAAKTKIDDDQAIIATKSEHIQGAQEHADKIRGELDRVLTAANAQLTEAEGLKARTQSASDTVTSLLAESRTSKTTIDADAATIKEAVNLSNQSAEATKTLADKAANVEQRITQYEGELAAFKKQSEDQLKTIEGLLPGAASAGLAHAFDERRKTFLGPGTKWQWVFVGSLVGVVVISGTGLWHAITSDSVFTYDELFRLWLSRLPIIVALVWLAVHSSHEAALAKRLEEDYGYKAAISSSFLGFNKQMSELSATAAEGTPLAKLCTDTLTTIATPPGRIYDKHKLTAVPSEKIISLATKGAPN